MCLQSLDVLARGDRPRFEDKSASVEKIFERRVADAFRCLGFEVTELGQGTGRKADALALARRDRFALIIDAKVREAGYKLGTEDRKFLDYSIRHARDLAQEGIERIYFVVVGSKFAEADFARLRGFLTNAPIRGVAMLSASALIRIVEDSIRSRYNFALSDVEKEIFASNRVIA